MKLFYCRTLLGFTISYLVNTYTSSGWGKHKCPHSEFGGVDVKASHAYMWPAINEKRAVFRISLRPFLCLPLLKKEKKISVSPKRRFQDQYMHVQVWVDHSMAVGLIERPRASFPLGLQKCHRR